MKQLSLFFLSVLFLLSSCQKSISDFDPSTPQGAGTGTTTPAGTGTFEATINGTAYSFNVYAATLVRSTAYSEKRLDITGRTADNTKQLIITLGEETSQGNAVSVKKYTLNAFPADDPNTPADESATTQGFTTYSTGLGNNSWITSVYDEAGTCTVTSCDANTKRFSCTFSTTLTDLFDNSILKITAGKINNVQYTVLN